MQDRLFWTETLGRGIVLPQDIPAQDGISLWQGDITRLGTDGIVNAANKGLLGCFLPNHNCIDNVIHSAAGMQLRDDCAKLIAAQGHEEECGDCKVTRAYNLPSKYVLHTVGPMVRREVTEEDRAMLRSCYTSCLEAAQELEMRSLAFCCISTGVFSFPQEEAAEIAAKAQPREMWLTHYSPSLNRPEEFMEDVRKIFPRAKAARDGKSRELKFDEE